ncbi:aminotransferase class I/II-fold pyridoxal phosphate-dependent enzyme [Microbaculum marinum]|uniref:Aminotransferase class I/II-fold pyridoxal phosphate-dependent enzyme n=1 Tax=Microbaculum marinum TaxID=1764581 RepID=A0AAW9RNR6_9HYPH
MSAGKNTLDPETLVAQALGRVDGETGAVVPPMHSATTFARGDDYALIGSHIYSRDSAPTVAHAEEIVAALDGGGGARLFGSGLAAIAALLETLEPDAHVLAPQVMYYAAQDWMRRLAARGRISLDLYDQTRPETLEPLLQPGRTKLVWIETPANPTWDVVDIAATAALARSAGALLGVDSTCAPPPTTRPLELGADIVFHSATKYLNGHSDLTAGVLVASGDARLSDIHAVRNLTGGVLGGFEAWLLIRGMRTLFVRFARQSETALSIARHFEAHPRVSRVLYPGLESHPGHAVARSQMTGGFGGMLSILVDGSLEDARRVATATRVFVPATSLGGVESLIEHRRSVESPTSTVPDTLLRLSVGLESADDLIADLEQALSAA